MNQNSDQNKWLVIVNPNAGNGNGKKDWNRISSLLLREDLQSEVKFTERKSQAIVFAREGINAGFRKIITVGGDGTLNEVVNGVFLNSVCNPGDVSLALIPVGTGNDWGRMFGIPLDYEKAVKIICNNKVLTHDIGLISYYDKNEEKKRYFINIAGLGFESVVVRRTNFQKDKGRGGKLIYFYSLLMSLFSYRNTPNALPDDGFLDLTVINGMGKFEIIRNLKILYDGTILSHPKVDGYRCKSLKVSSESLLYAEADGESLGHTPVEFSIIPAGINIVYGTNIIL